MNIKKTFIKNKTLIAIFILALLIRIIFIYSMPVLFWDESVYLNLGQDLSKNPFDYSFSSGWRDFIPGAEEHPYSHPNAGFRAPLMPYVLSIFYLLNLTFLIPFIPPLVGALSVVLIYVLGKEMFNKKVGILAALFLALIPLHTLYSGRVLTENFLTFFILLTFISFYKGYEENNNQHKVLFGVFLALALLSRYTALWIMPTFLIYFLIRDRSLKFLKDKHLWLAVLAFFIVLTPWLIYGSISYGNPLGPFIHGYKAGAYWGGQQLWNFFFVYSWQLLSVISIVFLASIIYIACKKDFAKKQIYLLLIWFSLFLAFSILISHKEERFIIPLLPPLILISAYFINKIKLQLKWIALITIILIISLISSFQNHSNTYNNINTKCFSETVDFLNTMEGDFLIVSESSPLFKYYVGKESLHFDKITAESIKHFEETTNKPIYFVFTRFNSGLETEEWQSLKKILDENYQLVYECPLDPDANWVYRSQIIS